MMKVCFDTFGCKLNKAETLALQAGFEAAGWEVTHNHSDANLIVIRGCSVTRRAQVDCEKEIARLEAKYPMKQIVVTGCIPGRKNEAILQRYSLDEIPSGTARAYLKVQDGCNGKCTYCIIPKFRGPSKSVDYGEVLDKAKRMIDSGYSEIIVTGCNLSMYFSNGKSFPDLVADIADIAPDSCRIRIGSVEPAAPTEELVNVIAEHDNVCRHIHLSVQSGSKKILAAMRRPYNVETLDRICEKANSLLDSPALGCDMISGFPGESSYDHLCSENFIKRHNITSCHSFKYSERPGTAAASFLGSINPDVRSMRAHKLVSVASANNAVYLTQFVGKTVRIVVENQETQAGWTDEHIWCRALNVEDNVVMAMRCSFQNILVTGIESNHLVGEIVGG